MNPRKSDILLFYTHYTQQRAVNNDQKKSRARILERKFHYYFIVMFFYCYVIPVSDVHVASGWLLRMPTCLNPRQRNRHKHTHKAPKVAHKFFWESVPLFIYYYFDVHVAAGWLLRMPSCLTGRERNRHKHTQKTKNKRCAQEFRRNPCKTSQISFLSKNCRVHLVARWLVRFFITSGMSTQPRAFVTRTMYQSSKVTCMVIVYRAVYISQFYRHFILHI